MTPSLEQQLRFVDLSFEVAAEAARLMPSKRTFVATDDVTLAPNHKRMALIRRLRLAAMEREGLPMELLPEGERVVAARAAA